MGGLPFLLWRVNALERRVRAWSATGQSLQRLDQSLQRRGCAGVAGGPMPLTGCGYVRRLEPCDLLVAQSDLDGVGSRRRGVGASWRR